jgi:RHS repeat-associated protein
VEGKADGSGLVYDRNRYYDPGAGRFTQEDPAGLAGGLNLYGYAGADPANNADPFGLWPAWMEKIGAAVTSYVRAQVDELKQPCGFSCGMRMATSMTLGMTGGVGEVGEAAGAGGLRAEFNSVVRPQFWKSEATGNAEAYSSADLARMANGKPPIGSDGFPMELHHDVPLKDGGTNDASNLKPMTRTDHRLGANYKVNHPDQPPEDYYF